MTSRTSLTLLGVIFFATLGFPPGSNCTLLDRQIIDIERMEKIVERWGHILRLKKEDIHKANQWFDRYGIWTVFFCRMVPVLRSLISIPAGMNHMDMGCFSSSRPSEHSSGIRFSLASVPIWANHGRSSFTIWISIRISSTHY